MKRKNFKSLKLHKKIVTRLNTSVVKGGTGALPTDAIGCTAAFSDNCSSGDPNKMCSPC
ncbi:MAG: hypothetical protein AAF611_12315 [Bacteroidota bacterium]